MYKIVWLLLIPWEQSSPKVICNTVVWVRSLKSDGPGSSPTFKREYLPIHQASFFFPPGHTTRLHFPVSPACNTWKRGRNELYFFKTRPTKNLPLYQPLSLFPFQIDVSAKGDPEESPSAWAPEWLCRGEIYLLILTGFTCTRNKLRLC